MIIQNSEGLIQSTSIAAGQKQSGQKGGSIVVENSNKDLLLQLQKGAELLIQKERRKDKSVALNFLSFADLTGKSSDEMGNRALRDDLCKERSARKHDVMLSDCRYV